MAIKHFFTKVVGVTQGNRQQVLASLQQYESLDLEHEDDNPVDPNAVAVNRSNGQQLGYLNRDLAKEVATRNQQGYRYAVFVKDVTGGGDRNLGCNLLIVVSDPQSTDAEAQAYLNNLISSDPQFDVPTSVAQSYRQKQSGCFGLLLLFVFVGLLFVGIAGWAG